MFISFDRIPQKKNRINGNQRNIDSDIQFDDDENEDDAQNEENEANKMIENKEEIIKKEKEFLNGEKELIKRIYDKIQILPLNKEDAKQTKDYSHLRTITSLNRLCYGVMKLRKIFKQIKYEKENITDDDIINTVFELLFRDDNEKLVISESIKNAILKELIEENKKKMEEPDKEKYEKYFFENSESLKNLY